MAASRSSDSPHACPEGFGNVPRWPVTAGMVATMKRSELAVYVILTAFFGWTSPAAYVFSLCVAIGGIFWAWLYARSQNLYSIWVSHLMIDAGIFVIGYDLIKGFLAR